MRLYSWLHRWLREGLTPSWTFLCGPYGTTHTLHSLAATMQIVVARSGQQMHQACSILTESSACGHSHSHSHSFAGD